MQSNAEWFRALTDRLGVYGAAERLGVPPASVRRAVEGGARSLRPSLGTAVASLMASAPDLPRNRAEVAYTDPRHEMTIPVAPYPDEVHFFGRTMAFKASRWRYLSELSHRAQRESPGSPVALRARRDLLSLEIQLLRDDGMTLATSQRHSQAVNSPKIRLREQWEWRERELQNVRAGLVGTMRADKRKRRTFRLFVRPHK